MCQEHGSAGEPALAAATAPSRTYLAAKSRTLQASLGATETLSEREIATQAQAQAAAGRGSQTGSAAFLRYVVPSYPDVSRPQASQSSLVIGYYSVPLRRRGPLVDRDQALLA